MSFIQVVNNFILWILIGSLCEHFSHIITNNLNNTNEVANVLATRFSNQVTSSRRIATWHYDVVFVHRNGHSVHSIGPSMS